MMLEMWAVKHHISHLAKKKKQLVFFPLGNQHNL